VLSNAKKRREKRDATRISRRIRLLPVNRTVLADDGKKQRGKHKKILHISSISAKMMIQTIASFHD
jgi:hypothetical protein